MNTPAQHPQMCPAGDRPEGGLLPTSGRDTARGGLSAQSASTSGVYLPVGRQTLPRRLRLPGLFGGRYDYV